MKYFVIENENYRKIDDADVLRQKIRIKKGKVDCSLEEKLSRLTSSISKWEKLKKMNLFN